VNTKQPSTFYTKQRRCRNGSKAKIKHR